MLAAGNGLPAELALVVHGASLRHASAGCLVPGNAGCPVIPGAPGRRFPAPASLAGRHAVPAAVSAREGAGLGKPEVQRHLGDRAARIREQRARLLSPYLLDQPLKRHVPLCEPPAQGPGRHGQRARHRHEQGQVTVTVPASAWFALRALPLAGPDPGKTFLRTIDVNRTPPVAGGRPEVVHTISAAVIAALVEQSGIELSPGRGVVSGVAVYFNGQTPPGIDPAQPYGNRDGRYAVVDVAPAEAARVELWGVPDGEAEPVLVACEETGVHADSLSILVLQPARSDGPAKCGQDPW